MSYWIFKRDDGTCLAIEEAELDKTRISDDLGELVYDNPMPRIIARLHVTRTKGEIIPGYDPRDPFTRFVAPPQEPHSVAQSTS